jgi:predicted RNase H-like nuclease (RuvC/YqgF family)
MPADLAGIIVPVVVAVILSTSAAFAVNRYSGPAQAALVTSLDGRLRVVTAERDEMADKIPRLEARIADLEAEVGRLQRESASLYRRLDAAEERDRSRA